MHRFWNSVTEPVLNAVRPRTIIEIGAFRGRNTAKILDFCRRNDAAAHVIDPMPEFSVSEWRQEWPEGAFYEQRSLDALPHVDSADVVLIDGDHNWYTVFNELRLIEELAGAPNRFPIVLLHDVDWPYGRRDSYHDVDVIPEEHRQPSARLGIRPGHSELVEHGGINSGFEHAIYEGTARNGVLTAIEDFISSSEIEFKTLIVPGMNGLGIVASSSSLQRNPLLTRVLTTFESTDFLVAHCREVEIAGVQEVLRCQEKRRHLKRRVRELERQVGEALPAR